MPFPTSFPSGSSSVIPKVHTQGKVRRVRFEYSLDLRLNRRILKWQASPRSACRFARRIFYALPVRMGVTRLTRCDLIREARGRLLKRSPRLRPPSVCQNRAEYFLHAGEAICRGWPVCQMAGPEPQHKHLWAKRVFFLTRKAFTGPGLQNCAPSDWVGDIPRWPVLRAKSLGAFCAHWVALKHAVDAAGESARSSRAMRRGSIPL